MSSPTERVFLLQTSLPFLLRSWKDRGGVKKYQNFDGKTGWLFHHSSMPQLIYIALFHCSCESIMQNLPANRVLNCTKEIICSWHLWYLFFILCLPPTHVVKSTGSSGIALRTDIHSGNTRQPEGTFPFNVEETVGCYELLGGCSFESTGMIECSKIVGFVFVFTSLSG